MWSSQRSELFEWPWTSSDGGTDTTKFSYTIRIDCVSVTRFGSQIFRGNPVLTRRLSKAAYKTPPSSMEMTKPSAQKESLTKQAAEGDFLEITLVVYGIEMLERSNWAERPNSKARGPAAILNARYCFSTNTSFFLRFIVLNIWCFWLQRPWTAPTFRTQIYRWDPTTEWRRQSVLKLLKNNIFTS